MHYRITICNKQSINGVALSVAMLMHKVCVPINLILFVGHQLIVFSMKL